MSGPVSIKVISDVRDSVRTLVAVRPDSDPGTDPIATFDVLVPIAFTNAEAIQAIHDKWDEIARSEAQESLAGRSVERPNPEAEA